MAEAVYATLHTNAGPIRLELFPNHAPKTVRNFVELAEGTREYIDPRTGQPGSGPYYVETLDSKITAIAFDGCQIRQESLLLQLLFEEQ